MDSQGIESLTSAVAPIVMVSAAGLLFNGIQTKNLHLSDRIRALAAEWRNPMTAVERQEQIRTELALFDKRIRLSQWALDFLYIAILCFVITSLLLASALWIGPPVIPGVIPAIFITGVSVLVLALVLEFVEMWISLKTIAVELGGITRSRQAGDPP